MKEFLVRQEFGNLNVLPRLFKVLFVWHVEAKFVIRQKRDGCRLNEINKLPIAADEYRIVRKLALLHHSSNLVQRSFVSLRRAILFIRCVSRQDKPIDLCLYPSILVRWRRLCMSAPGSISQANHQTI